MSYWETHGPCGSWSWRDVGLFGTTVFATVATILGTGILSLPVSLAESGLWPFLSAFFVCLLMQLSVVFLMVELLQRTQVIVGEEEREEQNEAQSYDSIEPHDGDTSEDTPLGEKTPIADLHRMGEFFLGPFGQKAFEAAVMLHFVSVLVGYTLAGAVAYASLFSVEPFWLIAPFWVVGVGITVFGASIVRGFIANLTVVKLGVLLFMAGIVLVLSTKVGLVPHSNFAHVMDSYLLGTVAVGGAVNTMPFMYQAYRRTAVDVYRFRTAVATGVVVCWVLNVVWAVAVLSMVPQTERDAEKGEPSLEEAQNKGQISTVPVTEIIDRRFPSLHWVSVTVTAFIVLSVTVSFVTIGSGLKHVIDGMAREAFHDKKTCCGRSASLVLHQFLRYSFWFGLIVLVAQANPQGFLVVLEVFTSLALNIEAGVCLGAMYFRATSTSFFNIFPSSPQNSSPQNSHLVPSSSSSSPTPQNIPLPLSTHFGTSLARFVIVVFSIACLWDVGKTSVLWLGIGAVPFLFSLVVIAYKLGLEPHFFPSTISSSPSTKHTFPWISPASRERLIPSISLLLAGLAAGMDPFLYVILLDILLLLQHLASSFTRFRLRHQFFAFLIDCSAILTSLILTILILLHTISSSSPTPLDIAASILSTLSILTTSLTAIAHYHNNSPTTSQTPNQDEDIATTISLPPKK